MIWILTFVTANILAPLLNPTPNLRKNLKCREFLYVICIQFLLILNSFKLFPSLSIRSVMSLFFGGVWVSAGKKKEMTLIETLRSILYKKNVVICLKSYLLQPTTRFLTHDQFNIHLREDTKPNFEPWPIWFQQVGHFSIVLYFWSSLLKHFSKNVKRRNQTDPYSEHGWISLLKSISNCW